MRIYATLGLIDDASINLTIETREINVLVLRLEWYLLQFSRENDIINLSLIGHLDESGGCFMSGREVISGIKVEEAITDFLIHFPFFDRLSKDELDLVVNHIHIVELDPGDVLFEEGDKGDSVFFIVEGELDVIKEPRSKNDWGIDQVVITKLSKGRTVGEMSVIDKIPRSATVKAAKKSTLVTLTDQGFDMVLKDHPKIGVEILKGIAQLLSLNMRKTSSLLVDSLIPIT